MKTEYRNYLITITSTFQYIVKRLDGSTLLDSDGDEFDSHEEAMEEAKQAIDNFIEN